MTEKEGTENTEFVKEEGDEKRKYIFQKNTITKTGTYIIIGFLIVLVLGLMLSGVLFGN